MVEGDLRREIESNIKRLVDIGCYRGRRHRQPASPGQNTKKNNARAQGSPEEAVARAKKVKEARRGVLKKTTRSKKKVRRT